MENYLTVELGRKNISNNEVIIELGKSICPAEDILQNLEVGNIIELNKKASSPADIFVKGQLAAKAQIVSLQESIGVKIVELFDESNNILNLTKDEIIMFDKEVPSYENFTCNVFSNNFLAAKGVIVVMNDNFALRIVKTQGTMEIQAGD